MKPQDIFFIVLFAGLLLTRKPKMLVFAGLVCLLCSIPLFYLWIFFTAQRLVMYAAACFATYILISLLKPNSVQ